MENQAHFDKKMASVTKKINELDLNQEIDRLFQAEHFHPIFKSNCLVHSELLTNVSKYVVLRAQNTQQDSRTSVVLITLHHQIRQSIKFHQFANNLKKKASAPQFLYNIIILSELASRLLQTSIPQLPLFPHEIFITLVFIATSQLVSPKCYFLLRAKMKRPKETTCQAPGLRSKNRPKAEMATANTMVEVDSLLADFTYSLKATLCLQKPKTKSLKEGIRKYAALHRPLPHSRQKTQQIPLRKVSSPAYIPSSLEPSTRHRISLESKLEISDSIKSKDRGRYFFSSKTSVCLDQKIKSIITNHKGLTRLKLL